MLSVKIEGNGLSMLIGMISTKEELKSSLKTLEKKGLEVL